MQEGGFTKTKKWIAGIVGLGVLWASIVFSKNGFQFETQMAYTWIGWMLSFAACSAQFMVTSDFRKINWSILALGVVSYVYSIYTNIQGFHSLRPSSPQYDIVNVLGSIFMDVYPEVAIAWALGESKLGDLLGNVLQSMNNPQQLTNRGNGTQQTQSYPKPNVAQNLPRKNNNYPTQHQMRVEEPEIPEFLMRRMKGK